MRGGDSTRSGPGRRARRRSRSRGSGRRHPSRPRGLRRRLPRAGPLARGRRVPGESSPWELMLAGPWHPDPNVRRAPAGLPLPGTGAEIRPLMFNAVGGSTIHYTAIWNRLLPSDFRVRPRRRGRRLAVPLRGPAAVLRAHRRRDGRGRSRGRSRLSARCAAADAAASDRKGRPQGRGGDEPARLALVAGHERDRSRPYGRLAPARGEARARAGCPEGAKASTDITHWPDALRHGARLVTGARVREIVLDAAAGRAEPSTSTRAGGASAGGSVVILAANGSERRAAAALDLAALPGRPRELLRPRRQAPHAAPRRRRARRLRGGARELARPARPPVARSSSTRPTSPAASRAAPSGISFPASGRSPSHCAPAARRTWGPAIHETCDRSARRSTGSSPPRTSREEANGVTLDPS